MAFTKIPVAPGDVISSAWGNHIQTQYDEAVDASVSKSGDVMTGPLQVDAHVEFQGVKKYHYSRSNPYQGLVELGRFTMTEAHDQVWMVGDFEQQTGSSHSGSYFNILIRTTTNAEVEVVRIYQEQLDNQSSPRATMKIYTRGVSGGTEVVVCAESTGNQFAAYELAVFFRRNDGYEFVQADMREAFDDEGWTEYVDDTMIKHMPQTVNFTGGLLYDGNPVLPSRFNNGAYEVYDGGEWKSVGGGVKSVQRGRTEMSGSSTTTVNVSINSVDRSKSFVSVGGQNLHTDNVQIYASARLTSSTNLRIERHSGGSGTQSSYINWEVVEFN